MKNISLTPEFVAKNLCVGDILDLDFHTAKLEVVKVDAPISRRMFLLAIHYAYGICKGQNILKCPVLFYHLHYPGYLKELIEDFPNLKILNMMRNPAEHIHSAAEKSIAVNDSKLNLSDALIYSGRNYRIPAQIYFELFHKMSSYLREDQVLLIKLDNLYEDLEGCMRMLTVCLGIKFTENLLQSTFDGKLYWGEETHKKPINNLDPNTMTDKWKKSLNRIDIFVIEGISYELLKRYHYSLTTYKNDSILNRFLVALSILLPNKAEWKQLGFYLNPLTHFQFLVHAKNESIGKMPLKDYTWNATYLYKWTYLDLKLWTPRWYNRFVSVTSKEDSSSSESQSISFRNLIYIVVNYLRFWRAILTYPMEIAKRYRIYYNQFFRRLRKQDFLPPLLEEIVEQNFEKNPPSQNSDQSKPFRIRNETKISETIAYSN